MYSIRIIKKNYIRQIVEQKKYISIAMLVTHTNKKNMKSCVVEMF